MFSGIVETLGEVIELKKEQSNLHITLRSEFSKDLKIDQSVAHNGVCLTVIGINDDLYTVTAIDETLRKTNLGYLKIGDKVNLERCLRLGDRLDGHIVQGHVDQTGTCIDVKQSDGSWIFTFDYDGSKGNVTVEKGSICVNGVSLTVVNSKANSFSVCIIPYTFDHTNFNSIQVGTIVNLEFDILGKYISKLMPK
ncbi:MAG: riboflavin synthase [Bacteroidetes bacterium]|nr:riboflavin synthase [Bacteroidota bacterium]